MNTHVGESSFSLTCAVKGSGPYSPTSALLKTELCCACCRRSRTRNIFIPSVCSQTFYASNAAAFICPVWLLRWVLERKETQFAGEPQSVCRCSSCCWFVAYVWEPSAAALCSLWNHLGFALLLPYCWTLAAVWLQDHHSMELFTSGQTSLSSWQFLNMEKGHSHEVCLWSPEFSCCSCIWWDGLWCNWGWTLPSVFLVTCHKHELKDTFFRGFSLIFKDLCIKRTRFPGLHA